MNTVEELGEHALIERIHARVPSRSVDILVGIGDDAAVLEPKRGTLTVVTTDGLEDGIHFDRNFCTPADIGHRALAVNLSDLAAMGATPHYILLSLALPPTTLVSDIDQMVDTLVSLATQHHVHLVGGNITASAQASSLHLDITAIGSVKRRSVLTRDAARAGDILYLSGDIGGAVAGLASLQQRSDVPNYSDKTNASQINMDRCHHQYRRPDPRVRLGMALGRNRAARACIALSAGLADALQQVTIASHVGARVNADALPLHPQMVQWFQSVGVDPLTEALMGGDDYELLFTAPPSFRGRLSHVAKQVGNIAITPIGVITKEQTVVLHRNGTDVPMPSGFEHFSKPKTPR